MKEIRFSPEFCANWKSLLLITFDYKLYEDFIIQRNINFKKILNYLPLLSYSDLSKEQATKLSENVGSSNFQIRYLDFDKTVFSDNDTVTLRLDIANESLDELWKGFTGKCRNQIRKAEKSGLFLKTSEDKEEVEKFFKIYRRTMKYYGSPSLPLRLFNNITEHFSFNVLSVYSSTTMAAGMIVLYDKEVAWVPWAASDRAYLSFCPNHLIYWEAIKLAQKKKLKIFDFGRSPYNGRTYDFKKQWGTYPVKIELLNNIQVKSDIYKKYFFVSKIWRQLPDFVTNICGPVLTKYLTDL